MELELTGRHALVCGASRGIGQAAAVELARLGANVTVLARSAERLIAVADALPHEAAGQRHDHLAVDMSDRTSLADRVQTLIAERPVQILINNTGGPPGGSAHAADPEAYLAAFRQHLVAAQTLLQAVLPHMREAGWGRIVNVISTSVREPIAGLGVSNTVRAAMAGWAKTVSGEIAAHGITVNNVLPGYTRTDRLAGLIQSRAEDSGRSQDEVAAQMLAGVPAGRFGEPGEVAAMIAFLCTPAAAYVDGVSIAVDGGRTRALA